VPKKKKIKVMLPPCAESMGCLCAGHARGNAADAACDTRELPVTKPDGAALLAEIFELAEAHGQESDPEHEVGDLQDVVRLCWHWLNPLQREHVLREFRAQRSEDQ
jgi:hypothetical protein